MLEQLKQEVLEANLLLQSTSSSHLPGVMYPVSTGKRA